MSLIVLDTTYASEMSITEVTDLVDIDRRVAQYLADVVDNFDVTDTDRDTNKEFVQFVDLDVTKKLFYGTYDDPQEFMRKLVGSSKRDRESLLPVFYVGRQPSIVFADGSDYTDQTYGTLKGEDDGIPYATINKSFAKLTYDVSMLAWSRATSDRMALAFAMWLRHNKDDKRTFTAKTMLANNVFEPQISIEGKKDAMFEPLDFTEEKKRVSGYRVSLEFVVEIFEAVALEGGVGTLTLEEGTPLSLAQMSEIYGSDEDDSDSTDTTDTTTTEETTSE